MSNAYLMAVDDALSTRAAGRWAVEKLDYLARYIALFETAMRERFRYRNYVDHMAGPGKNRIRGTGQVVLGSPLLALTAGHPFTRYFFLEIDPENGTALRQRCNESIYANRVTIKVGDCNQVIDDILEPIRRDDSLSLNLAFLDPEGFELRWETVAKLAALRRMDLIINYAEGGLNRLMEKLIERDEETIIDGFFGGPDWRTIYHLYERGEISRIMLRRRLINLYRDKLLAVGYKDVQRGDEISQAEPLMRNTRRAPLYRLLFASKHKRGIDFWQKITRRDAYGQGSFFRASDSG